MLVQLQGRVHGSYFANQLCIYRAVCFSCRLFLGSLRKAFSNFVLKNCKLNKPRHQKNLEASVFFIISLIVIAGLNL